MSPNPNIKNINIITTGRCCCVQVHAVCVAVCVCLWGRWMKENKLRQSKGKEIKKLYEIKRKIMQKGIIRNEKK